MSERTRLRSILDHSRLLGIHHITATCGNAQTNLDFYSQLLGLRLVKLTVNFDDPSSYHLYYGDEVGSPGTLITFFSYPKAQHGSRGAGMFTLFSLSVPEGSLDFWKDRLNEFSPEWYVNRLGEKSLMADDPDGLRFHLVERSYRNPKAWTHVVGPENAVQHILGATIGARTDASKIFAQDVLNLEVENECLLESGQVKTRFGVGDQEMDAVTTPVRSLGGRGTIHHLAFQVATDADQAGWHKWLTDKGTPVSPVKDRQYFKSIYFRGPSGALCEIATAKPGFLTDESVSDLGSSLKLPIAYRAHRDEIEAALPKLKLPALIL